MDLLTHIQMIGEEAFNAVKEADSLERLAKIKVQYLGKKGPLTDALRQMKTLPAEDRPKIGGKANEIKNQLAALLEQKEANLEKEALAKALADEQIDVTMPGKIYKQGTQHIIHQVMQEIEDFFIALGYQVITGPEVESDFYNFQRMNLPENHPARDMQDTFYIDEKTLLRTHTSPVQARTMDQHDFSKGALKMISPGKVFRRDDDDATHSHQFHQIEGLVVGKGISMADLKGTLERFARQMFGENREIRLRPSYFPFTEPSVEVDISCLKCGGSGCNICKQTGWIEILGAGMVHPKVLELSGIDSQLYSGFAFGLGPDRVAMLKYGITDIRHFYQNDLRFLKQFQRLEG